MISLGGNSPLTTAKPRPRRRWFQYSLRSLLVVTTLLGVGLGCWLTYVRPFRVQAAAAEKLRAIGASIETRPGGPAWLCWIAGEEHFLDVVAVKLEHRQFKADDLRPLADLTRLERLYLAASPVDDEGLSHVRGLRRLRRLSLWRTTASDRGLRHLSGLVRMEVLDIQRNWQLTERSLAHLRGMKKLERLKFEFPVTDKGIDCLAALPNLRVESITCTGVSDQGLKMLSRFSMLRSLRITSSLVTDAGMRHLAALAGLEDLMLRDAPVTDTGTDCLRGLARLESLTLVDTQVTDAALPPLAQMPALQELRLWGDRVTFGAVARAFGGRAEFVGFRDVVGPQKDVVTLRGPQFALYYSGPVAGADLAHLRKVPGLKRLRIGGDQLTSTALVHVKGLSGLEELGTSIPLTDEGLACLGELTNLRVLGIGGQHTATPAGWDSLRALKCLEKLSVRRITDDRLGFIEDLTNLRSLGLGANPITGSGLVHVRGLAKLEEIMLVDCTRFTNDGLVHLKGLGNLQRLSVQYTQVTDAGLEHLYDLPKLRDVTMLGSKVTRAGRVRLSKALGLDRVLF